jgi:dTDP-3-amino-2,3,6-trideoxy-4-keto-D-glucose/dTDP-3-amino-3,4,6-trideoxy-alpha-D-glucose/dTDP-2,6-dideoxy-D-kanosamine transaminase
METRSMKVPFLSLDRENVSILPEILAATERVVRSGWVLYGPELEAFEHEAAASFGVKHCVGVSSGTDAVELALRAVQWGVRPVKVTAMTAPPTQSAIDSAHPRSVSLVSSTPTFTSMLLDPSPATRNATGADVHVQLFGLATDATGAAVEDIAHSMGAMVDGKMAGTMARCGAASAYPSKIMGAIGDGGFVVTNDDGIASRMRSIRHYGVETDGSGDITTRGQNSRLSELQAAYLRIKLKHVPAWIDRRREISARYNDELKGKVRTPYEPPGSRGVFHVWAGEHPERDRIVAALKERGVGVMLHYPKALHQYKRWRHLAEPGTLPVAERLAREVFSIPCYPYLRDEEQDAVIAAVKEVT